MLLCMWSSPGSHNPLSTYGSSLQDQTGIADSHGSEHVEQSTNMAVPIDMLPAILEAAEAVRKASLQLPTLSTCCMFIADDQFRLESAELQVCERAALWYV
jgi:hypothetical protein